MQCQSSKHCQHVICWINCLLYCVVMCAHHTTVYCLQSVLCLQMIATDNLDLGCTIFEKAATEKAIREIDERLIQQYTSRAKAKNSNQPFFDQSQLQGRFPLHLPDSLKPRPGHLNPAQQRVYEDFARIPRGAAGAHAAVGGGKPMASMDKVQPSTCTWVAMLTWLCNPILVFNLVILWSLQHYSWSQAGVQVARCSINTASHGWHAIWLTNTWK